MFLKYLANRGIIQQYIPDALTCVACNKRKPVEILSSERENELNAIIQYPSGSRTYYRDLSIYKLCRYLGLRISDACEIKFADINIIKMELYIIQKKTGKQIVMPLLPDILNTILKYLKCERPDCQCEYIFLKSVAPYGKINSLSGIIANLFNGSLTKSHILRRSFASELLQNGATASLVVDSLGHSDESNIHKYLALDTNQMRKCPMSLKDIEYKGLLL